MKLFAVLTLCLVCYGHKERNDVRTNEREGLHRRL